MDVPYSRTHAAHVVSIINPALRRPLRVSGILVAMERGNQFLSRENYDVTIFGDFHNHWNNCSVSVGDHSVSI